MGIIKTVGVVGSGTMGSGIAQPVGLTQIGFARALTKISDMWSTRERVKLRMSSENVIYRWLVLKSLHLSRNLDLLGIPHNTYVWWA